jgi:hypothetical protein
LALTLKLALLLCVRETDQATVCRPGIYAGSFDPLTIGQLMDSKRALYPSR